MSKSAKLTNLPGKKNQVATKRQIWSTSSMIYTFFLKNDLKKKQLPVISRVDCMKSPVLLKI